MKTFIKIVVIATFFFGCTDVNLKNKINDEATTSQTSFETSGKDGDLFYMVKTLDSLFFDIAYNTCDTLLGRTLLSKDFEFYHDTGGPLLDASNELASDIMVEDLSWICKGTHRKLVDTTMEVYSLYENKELYGAIQTGDHAFYTIENNIPIEVSVNAKFIHLWMLEDTVWKLRRVFSYDHQKAIKN